MAQFRIEGWGKSVTVTIPDDMQEQGPEAFALAYDYEPTLTDPDDNEYENPDDKATFALNIIINFVFGVIRDAGVKDARERAARAAILELDEQMDRIDVSIEES